MMQPAASLLCACSSCTWPHHHVGPQHPSVPTCMTIVQVAVIVLGADTRIVCRSNVMLKNVRSRRMLKRYPSRVSYLLIGSSNLMFSA